MLTVPLSGCASDSLWKFCSLGKVKLCFRVATQSVVFILFPESQRLSCRSLSALPPVANSERASLPHMHARMFLECGKRPETLHGRRVEHVKRTRKGPRARDLTKNPQKTKPKSKSKVELSYVTKACCPCCSSYWLWMPRPKSISVLKVEVLPLPWPKPFLPLSHQKAA